MAAGTFVDTVIKYSWMPIVLAFPLGILFGIMILRPVDLDRWDRATVVKVCRDGSRVFRMEDGEYRVRARSSFRSFHAESADICAP
jgi:hypothetical protein